MEESQRRRPPSILLRDIMVRHELEISHADLLVAVGNKTWQKKYSRNTCRS